MNRTYLNMKTLIEKKHYPDKDTVMTYLDLFVMMNRISQDEYLELALLADTQYPDPVPEIPESDPVS